MGKTVIRGRTLETIHEQVSTLSTLKMVKFSSKDVLELEKIWLIVKLSFDNTLRMIPRITKEADNNSKPLPRQYTILLRKQKDAN